MRLLLFSLLVGLATADRQLRGLEQHDGFNAYYRALTTMVFVFRGGTCDLKANSAVCSMPGLEAKLVGKGTKNMPEAQYLEVSTIKGNGNRDTVTLYFNVLGVADILSQAFPFFDKSKSGANGYLQVLYDMICFYGGEGCQVTVNNNGNTLTKCGMGGSDATFVGVGKGPSPKSLVVRTLQGGSTKTKEWNLTGRVNLREILKEAFPDLHVT